MMMKRNESTIKNTAGLWEMEETEEVPRQDPGKETASVAETTGSSESTSSHPTESSSSSTPNNNGNNNNHNNHRTSSSMASFSMRSSLQEMSAVIGEGELPARTSFASHNNSRRLSSSRSRNSISSSNSTIGHQHSSVESMHSHSHPKESPVVSNNNDDHSHSCSQSMSTSVMSISMRQLRSRKGSFGSSTSLVLTESTLFGDDAIHNNTTTTTTTTPNHHPLGSSPKRRARKFMETMHKSRNAEQESTTNLWNESQLSLMQSVSILDVVDQQITTSNNSSSVDHTSSVDTPQTTTTKTTTPPTLKSCLKTKQSSSTQKKHARFAVNPETDRAWTLIRTFAPDHHPGLWWSLDDRQLREEEDEDMADDYEVTYGDILESAYEAAMELQEHDTYESTSSLYSADMLQSQLTLANLAPCMEARGLEAGCYSIEEYVQEAREAILEETDHQRYEQARNVSLEYSFPLQLVMHKLAVLEHELLVQDDEEAGDSVQSTSSERSQSRRASDSSPVGSLQQKILDRLQEEHSESSSSSESVASLTVESAALEAALSSSSGHDSITASTPSSDPQRRLSILAEAANESHTSGGMTDFHNDENENDSESSDSDDDDESVVITQEALEGEFKHEDQTDQTSVNDVAPTSRGRSESNTSIDLMQAVFGPSAAEEKSDGALPSSSSSKNKVAQSTTPKPGNSSASLSMYFT